ncbi:MAG: sulfurtransferase complex subunit TusB [Hyphomicrobiaceae bacterium]
MLHTVNKSPFQTNALQSCLQHVTKGDAVLLIEDAVVGAIKGTIVSGDIWARRVDVQFYVLGPDFAARGLTKDRLIDGIGIVDYGGFVDLVAQHKTNQAWL